MKLKEAVLRCVALFMILLGTLTSGCKMATGSVDPGSQESMSLLVPNDTEAKRVFRRVERLSKSRPQYAELRSRLRNLAPLSYIMLEMDGQGGAENNYIVFCAVQISEKKAFLLTNVSFLEDSRSAILTQQAIDFQCYLRTLRILNESTQAIERAVDSKTFAVPTDDSQTYIISWQYEQRRYRVCLYESFIGASDDGPKKIGIRSVDCVVENVNKVINELYSSYLPIRRGGPGINE